MSRIQLAMFDWDGTLLNNLLVVYESVVEIFRAYNLPAPTLEQYRNEIESDFMKFYINHGIPPKTKPDDLNTIRGRYLQEHGHRATLRPKTRRMLKLCQELGVAKAIVSSSKQDLLLKQLKQWGLLPLFDQNKIRGSSYDKEKVMLEMLDLCGVPAEKAFYLDDSADGLQAAKNLGIVTIGITSGYYPKKRILEMKPDFHVDSLEEIMEIIVANTD